MKLIYIGTSILSGTFYAMINDHDSYQFSNFVPYRHICINYRQLQYMPTGYSRNSDLSYINPLSYMRYLSSGEKVQSLLESSQHFLKRCKLLYLRYVESYPYIP
jgi:hypothetical protein